MVLITTNIIRKNRHFEETFKTPLQISKMSDTKIKEFLANYGNADDNNRYDFGTPRVIASPIDRPKKGLEFKSGETGSVEYFGPTDYKQRSEKEVDALLADIRNNVYFNGREIGMDTYFNKVLTEAVDRNLIKLAESDKTFFLGDLYSLRLSHAFKRDTIQRRSLNQQLKDYQNFARMSKEAHIMVC